MCPSSPTQRARAQTLGEQPRTGSAALLHTKQVSPCSACRINQEFCNLLESGPKPTVAAVQGMALGGGLEVAMACNGRIAAPGAQLAQGCTWCGDTACLQGCGTQTSDSCSGSSMHFVALHLRPPELRPRPRLTPCIAGTQLGLPELTLGILPGFGGTQRLPRLVGLQQGVQMILTSKPIKAEAGLKAGLVDAVVPPAQLLEAAKGAALDMAAHTRSRPMSLHRCCPCPPCSCESSPGRLLPAVAGIKQQCNHCCSCGSPSAPVHLVWRCCCGCRDIC